MGLLQLHRGGCQSRHAERSGHSTARRSVLWKGTVLINWAPSEASRCLLDPRVCASCYHYAIVRLGQHQPCKICSPCHRPLQANTPDYEIFAFLRRALWRVSIAHTASKGPPLLEQVSACTRDPHIPPRRHSIRLTKESACRDLHLPIHVAFSHLPSTYTTSGGMRLSR